MGFWAAGMTMLYLKYKHSKEKERSQNFYMFLAMMIAIIPTSFLNIILPDFGYYTFDWVGTLTSIPWVSVLAYSIIKHNQMSVRVVLTELLVLTAILIFFISIFV
ncbi:MAG: hypothetical protein KAS07_02635 [Candidatus Pacebacteria bacterium]|nr:hypothetical protein [Candidatus Paceibacterota bacterium]